VIDKTAENTIHTRFVVVKLSELPVYISGILVIVRRGEEEFHHKIENYHRSTTDDGDELDHVEAAESQLRHGTLGVGQLFMMGSSSETLSWLLTEDAEDADQPRGDRLRRALVEVDEFEFRVVAMAGNDDRPVASSRRFQIVRDEEEGEPHIRPLDNYTQQYSSIWSRKVAEEWSQLMREA
jgi:hypothetical protein